MTTRLIGAAIMVHGDDSGLVLPPRIAPYQVVIVPIGRDNWRETVLPKAQEIQRELVKAGIRVTLDEREERPGWKFAEWELRGVPLRLEIGPKDIEKSAVLVARRDTREKQSLSMENLPAQLNVLLDAIQQNLFDRAVAFRADHTQRVATYDEFKQVMEGRPGFVIAPWCGAADCEAQIKTDTQATIRNMPLNSPPGIDAVLETEFDAHLPPELREMARQLSDDANFLATRSVSRSMIGSTAMGTPTSAGEEPLQRSVPASQTKVWRHVAAAVFLVGLGARGAVFVTRLWPNLARTNKSEMPIAVANAPIGCCWAASSVRPGRPSWTRR
jgi:hypothetical protein